MHFRDSERFISRLFPATFIPLSGFSAFPSLFPLLTAIVGITKVAEQRASYPAATNAGQYLPWTAETNSSTPKTWMQSGCQQEAPYGSCASPIPHSHGWSLSPQTKKKENCPPPHPLPFQCCLKHNVNIALSIWIDKSGFVVSLFQDPAMAPGYVAFPFLYTCLISLGTPKEAPSPKCNCQSSLCLQTCPVSPAHRLGKALAASSHGPSV